MQRTLRETTWADGVDVRVRVGIHSGYPKRAAPNYVGMAVHTASRICGAAHGGQILVSGDTKLALRGSMPAGVRLRSLGRFPAARDARGVDLFQVLAKGLTASFPPPRDLTPPTDRGSPRSTTRARRARAGTRPAGGRAPRALSLSASSSSAAVRPSSSRGWRTELSGTAAAPANSMSS